MLHQRIRRFFCLPLGCATILFLPFMVHVLRVLYDDDIKSKGNAFGNAESESLIVTAKGIFSLSAIEEEVYKPFGYEIVEYTEPIAKIRRIQPQTCETIFNEWLQIAGQYVSNKKPIDVIPSSMYDKFSMFNHSFVQKWYFDDRSERGSLFWPKSRIDELVNSKDIKTYAYEGDGEAMYHAMSHYNLKGTTGVVIGSLSPWLEAYCLRCGAEKVITLEYKVIRTDHSRVGYYHPIEMAKNWTQFVGKFDFAASFSSIEHSGLGRFGDALDPFGDFRELQKLRCILKKGGYAFLGFPTGSDGIVFNAHRIYGRVRLPLLFEGFNLLDTYFQTIHEPYDLKNKYFTDRRDGKHGQLVFALQKIDD